MSIPPENADEHFSNPTAQQAVSTFMNMARQHFDEDELAVALVSTGAALLASLHGSEPAVAALRRAIRELRRGKPE
jgi:hypothetical protein